MYTDSVIPIGRNCRKNDVCGGGSRCDHGICSCPKYFFEFNSICMSPQGLRLSANPGKQNNFMHYGPQSRSYYFIFVGQTCRNGEICMGNSTCSKGGYCICKPGLVIEDSVCIDLNGNLLFPTIIFYQLVKSSIFRIKISSW